jgi:hypothetical protein
MKQTVQIVTIPIDDWDESKEGGSAFVVDI